MALTLISTHTASSSASLDITSGIDSTYPVYEFHFANIHPETRTTDFGFQVNVAGASGFNETIHSAVFYAYQNELGNSINLGYSGSTDQANGTGLHQLAHDTSNSADAGTSGILTLYAPSSTTFAKHFLSECPMMYDSSVAQNDAYATHRFTSGYINTTDAIDEIQFKMSADNIDTGVIKMYGVL